jgi:predicted amidohydrolase YtcJ
MRSSVEKMAGLAILSVAFAFAQTVQASDQLLVHGHIYTAAASGPKWAEAIAITGDHIDAVGSDAEILRLKTAKSKVIDLQGKTVIPGVTDNHVHLWFGSLALHGFNFSTPEYNITAENDPQLFASKIKAFAASHPKDAVLIGRAQFSNGVTTPAPTRALLDKIVPDRPLVIHATSEHTLWVNSKALELAGITKKPLADPAEEIYVLRDANGEPTGVLREAAMEAMERAIPDPPLDEKLAILSAGEHYLNSFGITSMVAATGGLKDLAAYDALRQRGELTLRIRQAFGAVAVNHHWTPQFAADLEKARTTYHDDWISANMVKFFMDGAPTAPLYTTKDYAYLVGELDKRGYYVMSHALTPAAAKVVVDGDDEVEKQDGPKDRRFRMEHAGRVNPEDLPRFGKLGIIPSMQPAFCCGLPRTSGANPPGKSNQWNSFEESGATLEFSSDWPCSWPPSPILGVQQATLRQVRQPVTPTGPTAGPFVSDNEPEERITVEQAVLAYTRSAAFANHTDKKLGTLEAGKLADLAVLSKDIFSLPHEEIGTAKVSATMVGGKVVYGKLQ